MSRPASATVFLVTALAAAVCACAGASDPAEVAPDTGAAAQSDVTPDVLATIEGDPSAGTAIALAGAFRYALVGARVRELESGRRYKLSLAATTEPPRDGDEVRALVDYRKVRRLVGTLADDARDPAAMQLTSLHARSYALVGAPVAAYKDIRSALPAHDYTRTLFSVSAVEQRAPGSRWEWLDYEPLPRFGCTQKDATEVHLDLVDVKPDVSMLDGFVKIPLGGREAQYGAHAECRRDGGDGAVYTCTLDEIGTPWGTARFDPASGQGGRFDLTISRTDAEHTQVAFACETFTREGLAPLSED